MPETLPEPFEPSRPSRLTSAMVPTDMGSFQPPVEDKPDYRRYIAALLRYKWLVALLTIVGAAGGILAGRFIKPVYVAGATIWIEQQPRGQQASGPLQSGALISDYDWVDLMRSYVVLDDVVRQLRLYLVPATPADSLALASFTLKERFVPGSYKLEVDDQGQRYTLSNSVGTTLETGAVGDSVGRNLGFSWAPARAALGTGRTVEFDVTSPRDASRSLAQNINPRIGSGGSFLKIELQGDNPSLLAGTVNGVIHRFVAVAAELKSEKLTELTNVLGEQLSAAQANLAGAEEALRNFQVNTITLPQNQASPVTPGLAQTQSPVYSTFFQMRIDRDQLQRDREAIMAALAQGGDSGVSADALRFVAAVKGTDLERALSEVTTKEAELRALRFKYSDEYAPLQRATADIRTLRTQTVPNLASDLVSQIQAREAELDRRIGAASTELRQIPLRSIEEGRLERNKATAEQIYITLRQRYEQSRIAEMESRPDVRILDEAAVPQNPVTNIASRFVLVGFVAGLGLGVGLAIVLDRVDSRVRYPEQVSRDMGLTILGAVPRVRGNGAAAGDATQVVEALRGVRLNLAHAYGSAGPLMVTISSPGSGDGKSFLSSNLALAFADAGHRTLLIDGDIRRGALHRVMNQGRKPGLTDFLSGKATREQILRSTSYPQLTFVPCGTRTQAGPELLGSAAMRDLIAGMRAHYSVIIVDSPPLGAGIDPFVLGTLTGNMMVVLRTGVTDREMAEAKLDVLDRLPIRVLGAVLNDVREGGSYRYYSYSYYISGYEATDEEGDEAKKLPSGAS